MTRYTALGIPYFNPQVPNWQPELAEVEAWHLANDSLILFPVTDETYAAGSLAETGFSVLNALRWNKNRFVLLYIAPDVKPELYVENERAAADSCRARTLVRSHLEATAHPNAFIVSSLEEMLDASLKLFAALQLMSLVRPSPSGEPALLSASAWKDILKAELLPTTASEGVAL